MGQWIGMGSKYMSAIAQEGVPQARGEINVYKLE